MPPTSTTSTSSWHHDLRVGFLECIIVDIGGDDVAQKPDAQMQAYRGGNQTPSPHGICCHAAMYLTPNKTALTNIFSNLIFYWQT